MELSLPRGAAALHPRGFGAPPPTFDWLRQPHCVVIRESASNLLALDASRQVTQPQPTLRPRSFFLSLSLPYTHTNSTGYCPPLMMRHSLMQPTQSLCDRTSVLSYACTTKSHQYYAHTAGATLNPASQTLSSASQSHNMQLLRVRRPEVPALPKCVAAVKHCAHSARSTCMMQGLRMPALVHSCQATELHMRKAWPST